MHAARLSVRLALLMAILGACVTPAVADPFPSRIVKLVVPQTPGGATDVFARKIGQLLSEHWGQPVIVENRAGAGGVIGTEVVAKSPPDGHTLLVTYAGSQAINASLYSKIPFDSVKDFQTVATLAVTPFILIVSPKLPAKDMAEFIALARAKPEALTYASSGNGSVNHLIGEMIKAETGIKILHVPYRGVAPAITDVVGGQVDSAFSSVPSVLQMVRSGNVRALAVSSAQRVAAAPEIPTIAESGLPGFDVNPWWGILAPAGTDMEIVRKINNDVGIILRTKAMVDFLAAQGAEPLISSPEQFLTLLEADVEKWAKVVKTAGVTLQ
jgi:tripartite-type tricarboxylate transporter receptor subunit TctC